MTRPKKVVLSLVIALLVVLSSSRVLDDYSDRYTNEAIKNAAITYATARGLNALVSMMQSSNVEASIGIVSGSMTIGELLDPLNDMIERFSTVMTWVMASLAGQKVLLLIASHALFLYLVAVVGIISILLILFGRPPVQRTVFKTFLVLIFIRFSLGLAVALNSAADQLFLHQQFEANDREVSAFQQDFLSFEPDEPLSADNLRESTLDFWQSLSLEELNRKITRGIENFINLVAIYLLKTILFPLGFFYAAFYGVRAIWRLELMPVNPQPAFPPA